MHLPQSQQERACDPSEVKHDPWLICGPVSLNECCLESSARRGPVLSGVLGDDFRGACCVFMLDRYLLVYRTDTIRQMTHRGRTGSAAKAMLTGDLSDFGLCGGTRALDCYFEQTTRRWWWSDRPVYPRGLVTRLHGLGFPSGSVDDAHDPNTKCNRRQEAATASFLLVSYGTRGRGSQEFMQHSSIDDQTLIYS